MELSPLSGYFKMLTGAAVAYGLTSGGAQAPQIEILPLGLRIVRPLKEGDDFQAKREAFLKPRIVGDIVRQYAGAPVPKTHIAQNVLLDMGVPTDKTKVVLSLILDGARELGFLIPIKGKDYFAPDSETKGESLREAVADEPNGTELEPAGPVGPDAPPDSYNGPSAFQEIRAVTHDQEETLLNRIYISHGKNTQFVETIKRMVTYGRQEPVLSVERQTVSLPVPDKVMSDMRGCGGAIIHVDAEDAENLQRGAQTGVLNGNVLIEIGAAMALYGRRFILLVRKGVQLPSNLQGLYEVRYEGDTLDANTTLALLEAITNLRTHPLPDRYADGH